MEILKLNDSDQSIIKNSEMMDNYNNINKKDKTKGNKVNFKDISNNKVTINIKDSKISNLIKLNNPSTYDNKIKILNLSRINNSNYTKISDSTNKLNINVSSNDNNESSNEINKNKSVEDNENSQSYENSEYNESSNDTNNKLNSIKITPFNN